MIKISFYLPMDMTLSDIRSHQLLVFSVIYPGTPTTEFKVRLENYNLELQVFCIVSFPGPSNQRQ